MTRLPRVALYARVSTRKGQTCENQLLVLREYAERGNFQVIDEYVDTGFSGAKQSRPALDRLVKDAHLRKFDVIIVWKFDRFARSTKHLIQSLEEFRHLGIQFVSLTEQIDTGSPFGQAIFTIVAAIAQLEKDLIAERVRCGLERAKAMGTKLGRPSVEISVEKVLSQYKVTKSVRATAKSLGISHSTVHRILQGDAKADVA